MLNKHGKLTAVLLAGIFFHNPISVLAAEENQSNKINTIVEQTEAIQEKVQEKYEDGFHEVNGKRHYMSNGKKAVNQTVESGGFEFTLNEKGEVIKSIAIDFPVYSQLDYPGGSTLCAITSFTSIVDFFSGEYCYPVHLANVMQKAGYYTPGGGTKFEGSVEYAFNQFGYESYGVELQADEVRNELLKGNPVLSMTVSGRPWVISSAYHCMVFSGYDSTTDQVYVHDTYTPSLSGWYDLDYIHKYILPDPSQSGPIYIVPNPNIEVIYDG